MQSNVLTSDESAPALVVREQGVLVFIDRPYIDRVSGLQDSQGIGVANSIFERLRRVLEDLALTSSAQRITIHPDLELRPA
jgi:hypothetical protein